MIVSRIWTNRPQQPLTSPFPVADGFYLAFFTGDLASAIGPWSNPVLVRRDRLRIPRPFLSFLRGRFGFYIGWKVWGVDNEDTKRLPGINPAEVYEGSVAMQGFTARFTKGL